MQHKYCPSKLKTIIKSFKILYTKNGLSLCAVRNILHIFEPLYIELPILKGLSSEMEGGIKVVSIDLAETKIFINGKFRHEQTFSTVKLNKRP